MEFEESIESLREAYLRFVSGDGDGEKLAKAVVDFLWTADSLAGNEDSRMPYYEGGM